MWEEQVETALVRPCVCWQLKDGGDNSDIESKYQQKGNSDKRYTKYIDHHLIHKVSPQASFNNGGMSQKKK